MGQISAHLARSTLRQFGRRNDRRIESDTFQASYACLIVSHCRNPRRLWAVSLQWQFGPRSPPPLLVGLVDFNAVPCPEHKWGLRDCLFPASIKGEMLDNFKIATFASQFDECMFGHCLKFAVSMLQLWSTMLGSSPLDGLNAIKAFPHPWTGFHIFTEQIRKQKFNRN